MKSRPQVISVETHGALYINPHLNEILNWMRSNNYSILYKDKSDTVFVHQRAFPVKLLDKAKLAITNGYLALRRIKQKLKAKR